MLRSMTGFGSGQAVVEGVEFAVEVRTVNNRYFKLSAKIPEAWSSVEPEIDKRVRSRVTRGSVLVAIRARVPDEQATYRVNGAALANYIDQVRYVEIEANPTLRIDVGTLLQLPGVLVPPPIEELCGQTRQGLVELVERVVEDVMKMRQVEGQALRDDLLANCDVIARQLAVVSERAPAVVQEYHDRLSQRVGELTRGARLELDADTLAREVAIYAERCDVAEEINRLTGHLEQFRTALDSPEPAGRKLDFIAQEMLREANTIGSKSNDSRIAQAVVEIKTAIDRIKEQAANVE
jgi:uncharacterized protein (TIGR00255 family)